MRDIYLNSDEESYSISYENKDGKKGKGGQASSNLGKARKGAPCIPLIKSQETITLADIKGSGIIKHLWMTVIDEVKRELVLEKLFIKIYYDGSNTASINCPLGNLFCLGFNQSYIVNSIAVCVNPLRGLNFYLPIPFKKSCLITLTNTSKVDIPSFFYQIDYSLKEIEAKALYLCTSYKPLVKTKIKEDYELLNIKGSGKYVGTFISLITDSFDWYGEGEFKFFRDGDKDYPSICTTGLEDYFGGAWSFGKEKEETFSGPYSGFPYISLKVTDPIKRCFYRFHLNDPIYFKKDLRVTLQQIGINEKGMFERSDQISSLVYYYLDKPL